MDNQKYYWSGTKSELLEICYALSVNNLIEGDNLHMLNFIETCNLLFELFGEKLPKNPYDSMSRMKKRRKKEANSLLYKSYKKCFDC